MKTIPDQELSGELQELYLENKEWLSQVAFLKDETVFLRKLFDQYFTEAVQQQHLDEVQHISNRLIDLVGQREKFCQLVACNQHLVETLLKDSSQEIGFDLIEQHCQIREEIGALFIADAAVKKELFTLVQAVIGETKARHLLTM